MDTSVKAYQIREIYDGQEKQATARLVLEALPAWFGNPEPREDYIRSSAVQPFFAAFDGEKPVGFLCLKETGRATVELCVMGVLQDWHRRGLGTRLFAAARAWTAERDYAFMQVKTVQMGRYKEYDDTNRFYLSLGFQEFEVLPTLWDEWNPCQIYVMALRH